MRPINAILLACLLLWTVTSSAQTQPASKPTTKPSPYFKETLNLWVDRAPMAKGDSPTDVPTLAVYLPEKQKANGCGVVVCPGGAYVHLSMVKEGSDVADWLASHGIAAFVLKYRISPYQQPVPLMDGQRAMRLVRAHASEWGVDPHRVGILGFSAGGHCASSVGTHIDGAHPDASDPIDRESARPDFMVLLYPVISMDATIAHATSRKALLGDNPSDELVKSWSNELQVTDQTPPTFIAHSKTDHTVKIVNSERFYEALQEHHVPSELVEFETGSHGWGLAPNDPKLSVWTEKCLAWMQKQAIIPGESK